MRLGEIVVGRGLATVSQIGAAAERQKVHGGRLGESLVAMGVITNEQLESVIHDTPVIPRTIAETGISPVNLLNLLMKFMLLEQRDTMQELSERLMLPPALVQNLLEEAVKRQFVQAVGSVTVGIVAHIRYALSERGRNAALEAASHNGYLGPAPVSLQAFQAQVLRQRITNEMVDAEGLKKAFEGLVVPEHYLRKIGPAVNAGRTVLLFGPAGNGKTTMATRLSLLFKHVIYVPYAIEIDGEIIKVYDPSIHKYAINERQQVALSSSTLFQRQDFDERWVACKRPVAMAGGELTMDMLNLQYSPESKFYEAPLHMKALNGVFVIDDFGRQQISPEALLNRWIVPMESRVDFMRLNTGKSFMIPFDELLIFSTNLEPSDLMNDAFLRRMPYKIKLFEPTRDEYLEVFTGVSKQYGLELEADVFDFIVERLTTYDYRLAYYQPKFICEQVIEACKYEGKWPQFNRQRAHEALANLYVEIENKGLVSDAA